MNQFDPGNLNTSRAANSTVGGNLYPFHEVCRVTGIEPSRIRFIEMEFDEYFGTNADGMQNSCFNERGIDLLRRIHQMIFHEGKAPFAIRQELARNRHRLKTIAVTSGKGGVGKTTISVNLAIAFARRSLRTLLLDADMGLGNVHVFAGITPRGSVMDVIEGKSSLENVLSPGPEGIRVLCGGSGNARLADLPPVACERLTRELQAAAGSFDVMLIDTGAGISSQVTHFLSLADDILVVTTPNIAATLDAYGVIKVARESAMRGQIHVLVNQVDDEAQAHPVHEKIRLCSERFLQYSPAGLGWLRRDQAMEDANQSRKPILITQPEHNNSIRITHIAGSLCAFQPSAEQTAGVESPSATAAA